MKKRLLVICLATVVGMSAFTACGNKKNDNNTLNTASTTEETLGAPGASGGAVPDSKINWPDKGSEMSPIIDAVVCASTDYPDIKYDYTDPKSFWVYTYYALCDAGTTGGLAVKVDGKDDTYTIKSSLVKVFSRIVFADYTGHGDLPDLPSDLKNISYDKSSDTYTYSIPSDLGINRSEVYACSNPDENGVYQAVSFYSDANYEFTPWSTYFKKNEQSDSPLFPYIITNVEKVDESVTIPQEETEGASAGNSAESENTEKASEVESAS